MDKFIGWLSKTTEEKCKNLHSLLTRKFQIAVDLGNELHKEHPDIQKLTTLAACNAYVDLECKKELESLEATNSIWKEIKGAGNRCGRMQCDGKAPTGADLSDSQGSRDESGVSG